MRRADKEITDKAKALDAIMTKHTGKSGFEYSEMMYEKTLIIKVEIWKMPKYISIFL